MTGKLNLDIHAILDKEFNIDFKGYSAREVDGFLDLVMEDYETYETKCVELNNRITELERINTSLRAKLIELEGRSRVMEANQSATNMGSENVDILKRLSRLENEVFAQNKQNR